MLLLEITVEGLFYYTIINNHFETIYKEKFTEYKNLNISEKKADLTED